MHSVFHSMQPFWRRSFSKEGTHLDLFGPAPFPPLGGSTRKTTTLVGDHEYFNPAKFHQNPCSGLGTEAAYVNPPPPPPFFEVKKIHSNFKNWISVIFPEQSICKPWSNNKERIWSSKLMNSEWTFANIGWKCQKMTKSRKTSKTRKKFDFRMEPKTTTLLHTSF